MGAQNWEVELLTLRSEVHQLRAQLREMSAHINREKSDASSQTIFGVPGARLRAGKLTAAEESNVGNKVQLSRSFLAWAQCAQQTQEAAALMGDSGHQGIWL